MAIKTASLDFLDYKIRANFKHGVKNFRLKIDTKGEISLTLPFYTTQKVAFEFLEKHTLWILNTRERILKNLLRDDEVSYFGKIYKLKFDEKMDEILIKDSEILAKNLSSWQKFKRKSVAKVFDIYIQKFLPFIGKNVNRVTIRNMRSRWGSCNTKKGYINLNLNLIEKKYELIEYVVLHELTHLIYANHKREFYEFIAKIMPDFRERERALNAKI